MDGTAVKAIEALAARAHSERFELDEGTFSTVPLHRLPHETKEDPVPTLDLQSLRGLVDYLDFAPDNITPEKHFLHVADPTRVNLWGPLVRSGPHAQRHLFAVACVSHSGFGWGQFLDTEALLVALQARYAHTEDRDRMLKLVGNLTAEERLTVEDDGVTQRATTRAGAGSLLEEVPVRNPFRLAPFRTFPEVEPPESPFVLRIRGSSKSSFTAGLWEADGGAWRLKAVSAVRAWLEEADTGFRVLG